MNHRLIYFIQDYLWNQKKRPKKRLKKQLQM